MRPATLLKNNILYWTIRTYNTSEVLTNADSTPTVVVLKNGSATGDSVTVTKRAATTGIYDCSYNPASEVEGDQFTIEESATISSTSNSWNWSCTVVDAYALASKIIGTLASGTHQPQSGDSYSIVAHVTYGNSALKTLIESGGSIGSGADLCTLTMNVGGTPLADADVWITADSAGTNVVAGTKQTNSLGQVSFLLDEGITYYLWMQKDGYNPILGESFVATP